ncbi:MAG: hypothetical protein PHG69_05560, partial [Candidatus Omnitrophica bacterium]|nr:hypothetical protein [Candidatus Omnitrophota bacterium]
TLFRSMISHISGFMTDLENLYNQIQGASIGVINFGGINPVIYEWNDSRGDHRVTVQVAPTVKMPRTQQEKHGNWWSGKKCVVLKDYEDTTGQNTWVRVIRQDPVAQDRQVGILGFWRSGSGEIDRTAHVSYRIGQVRLVH